MRTLVGLLVFSAAAFGIAPRSNGQVIVSGETVSGYPAPTYPAYTSPSASYPNASYPVSTYAGTAVAAPFHAETGYGATTPWGADSFRVPPPYSYYGTLPFPARFYSGYGGNDFPYYGRPYGSPSDPWTWPFMSSNLYWGALARYYYPPVR